MYVLCVCLFVCWVVQFVRSHIAFWSSCCVLHGMVVHLGDVEFGYKLIGLLLTRRGCRVSPLRIARFLDNDSGAVENEVGCWKDLAEI